MNFDAYCIRLFKSLYTLKLAMDRTLEAIVRPTGLTSLQAVLLVLISEGYISNVSSLCKELGLSQGNASALCKKLEKDGFLHRQRSKEDERIVILRLTEQGADTLAYILSEFRKLNPNFDQVPDDQYKLLLNSFDKLSSLLTFHTVEKK